MVTPKVLRNPGLHIEEVQDLEEELVELLGLGESVIEVLFDVHGNHDIVTLRATKRVERILQKRLDRRSGTGRYLDS